MKKYTSVCALALVVGACSSGNPFTDGADTATSGSTTTTEPTTTTVPSDIQGGLNSFTFNPDDNTLIIDGIAFSSDSVESTFRRRPALDILAEDGSTAYFAFTAQDDPLDEHTTAYVNTISGVSAAIALTGGQFREFQAGGFYTRDGSFNPVTVSEEGDTGLVSYAGTYVGLSNVDGIDTDLATVPGTVSDSIRPAQASVVNGNIFINVSFGDNTIKGIVYDRKITLPGQEPVPDPDPALVAPVTSDLPDLLLTPTTVADDGTFTGRIDIPGPVPVGSYGGVLGGENSEAIAGAIQVSEHFGDANGGEEEFGVFVLGQCGTDANNDPALCAAGGVE